MRTFKLINKDGVSYDLTEQQSFLYNVDGLGYSRQVDYQRIGNRYEAVKNTLAQGVINGRIRFRQPNAYEKYFGFVQFCQNGPLRLVYTPAGTPYYREGIVTQIGKTESADGMLMCTIQFSASTPFYRTLYEYNNGDITGGKEYNYTYNYVYSDSIAGTVVLQNDSYLSCPTRITIYGYAVNPIWRHYVNEQLVASGKANTTIEAGHKLVIDTTTVPYSIKQFDLSNTLISDVYQLSDFSTARFVTLRQGKNVISVSHEGSNLLKLGVEARIEYASV